MKTGLIYKITNTINNKAYIGKTRQTLEQRKKWHIIMSKKPKFVSLLYRSVAKYGWEKFVWETLEVVPLHILNQKEKEYIKKFGTLNIAQGGDGGDTITNHPDIDLIRLKMKDRPTQPRGAASKSYKKITSQQRQQILKIWNDLTIKCLKHTVEMSGISQHLVKRTLNEEGIEIPPKHITQQLLIKNGINSPSRKIKFTKEEIDNILRLYNIEQLSATKIAKIYGLKSGDCIIKILKSNNVTIRTKSENALIHNKKTTHSK